jgi:hypothetical protein
VEMENVKLHCLGTWVLNTSSFCLILPAKFF